MHENPSNAPSSSTDLCGAGEPPAGLPSGGWLRLVPNVLVLAAIGASAWFGHRTEWTFGLLRAREFGSSADLPAELLSTVVSSQSATSGNLCQPHGVFDCPHCHPDQAQLDNPPVADSREAERIQAALALRPRQEIDPACATWPRVVRFSSADAAEKAGIDVSPVWRESVTETIAASGELLFDPARIARLPARVAGSAWRVDTQAGSVVHQGDVLALIDSTEVGRLKTEFQQALVEVRLKTQLHNNMQDAPVADRRKREAKAELREAEIRLMSAEQALVNLGFTVRSLALTPEEVSRQMQVLGLPSSVARQPLDSVPGSLLPIRATLDGVVLESNVIAGEVVKADQVLFTVVDPSELWLSLSLTLADLGLVRIGQEVRFRPDGSTREVSGLINWIGNTADEHTRTVPVRVTLSNADGTLRAYSLGEGQIVLRVDPHAVVVPPEAVQSYLGNTFVFVRHKDFLKPEGSKTFHLRAVRLGTRTSETVEVIAGVLPGEVVASKGGSLLLNEISKDQTNRITMGRSTQSLAKQTSVNSSDTENR
jgi:cobalt-zinc-cadmium efflux system membrane fusion protein